MLPVFNWMLLLLLLMPFIVVACPGFRADMAGERFVYIMSGGQQTASANFRLPAGVTCSGGCVLQWVSEASDNH